MPTLERLAALWSGQIPAPLGRPGFALPDISGFEMHPIGDAAHDNWIVAPRGFDFAAARQVEIRPGDRGNAVIFGENVSMAGKDVIWGNDNTVILSGHCSGNLVNYTDGTATITYIGPQTTIGHATIFNQREHTLVAIGERCMLSHGIIIRSYDDHPIIDLDSGLQLNPAASIAIGPYVWLCPEVHILRGAKIGYGSIIGERSLVTSDIGRCVLAAGIPAKTLRENVSWDRPKIPRPDIHHIINADAARFS